MCTALFKPHRRFWASSVSALGVPYGLDTAALSDSAAVDDANFLIFFLACPASNEYIVKGVANLQRGKHVHTFHGWGSEFKIQFDLLVYGKWSNQNSLLSILHLTTGRNGDQFGQRIPSIFIKPNQGIYFSSYVGTTAKYVDYLSTQAFSSTSVKCKIVVLQKKSPYFAILLNCIKVNGVVVHCYHVRTPKTFEKVFLYMSSSDYESFDKYGQISNVEVIKITDDNAGWVLGESRNMTKIH